MKLDQNYGKKIENHQKFCNNFIKMSCKNKKLKKNRGKNVKNRIKSWPEIWKKSSKILLKFGRLKKKQIKNHFKYLPQCAGELCEEQIKKWEKLK